MGQEVIPKMFSEEEEALLQILKGKPHRSKCIMDVEDSWLALDEEA